MKTLYLCLILVIVVAACGGQSAPAYRPGATATYEAARAQLLATRQAQRADRDARPSPTATIARATATPHPTTVASLPPPTPVTLAADVSPLMARMPTLAELPVDFILTEDGPRSPEELAVAVGADPIVYREQLTACGFQRAAQRSFEWLDFGYGDAVPALEALDVVVIELDGPGSALAALEWHRALVGQAYPVVNDVEMTPLGDTTFAAIAERAADGGGVEHASYIWVQAGNIAIQFHARSTSADIFAETAEIARVTVEGQPNLLGAAFPTLDDLPDGFTIYYEGPQTIEEIAEMYDTDHREQIDRLNALGFSRSVFKVYGTSGFAEFTGPEVSTNTHTVAARAQQGVAVIYAEMYEFASPEQAREAVQYDYDGWSIRSWDNPLKEVAISPIGETSYALQGSIGMDGTEAEAVVILVQDGPRQYIFTGLSYYASGVPDLVSLVQSTVERARG